MAAATDMLNISTGDYALHVSKHTVHGSHRFTEALAKIVEGADLTAKLTKFSKAIITVAAACFQSISEGWSTFANQLSGFHEVVDFLMFPVAIKDMFDLARGKVKGWAKRVSTTFLVGFRILTSLSFLHNMKYINLSFAMTTIGSIPLLNLVTSGVGLISLSFDVVDNGMKLYNKDNRRTTAEKQVKAHYWEYIRVKNSESSLREVLRTTMDATTWNSDSDVQITIAKKAGVDLKKMDSLKAEIVKINFEIETKITANTVEEKEEVEKAEARKIKEETAAASQIHKDAAKAEKGLSQLIKMAKKLEKAHVAEAIKAGTPQDKSLTETQKADITKAAKEEFAKNIDIVHLETVKDMAELLHHSDTSVKIAELFKKAVVERNSIGNSAKEETLIKKAQEQLDQINSDDSTHFIEDDTDFISKDDRTDFRCKFVKLSRYEKNAEAASSDANANVRTKWLAILDRVVKIAFVSLMLAGMAGVSLFAMGSPIMIALVLGSAAISLGKAMHDKIYLDRPLITKKSPIEINSHDYYYDAKRYLNETILAPAATAST